MLHDHKTEQDGALKEIPLEIFDAFRDWGFVFRASNSLAISCVSFYVTPRKMYILDRWNEKSVEGVSIYIDIHQSLSRDDRRELYDYPLNEALMVQELGIVRGAGTSPDRKDAWWTIEAIVTDPVLAVSTIRTTLINCNAPLTTTISADGKRLPLHQTG